jgi:hypothetical protein
MSDRIYNEADMDACHLAGIRQGKEMGRTAERARIKALIYARLKLVRDEFGADYDELEDFEHLLKDIDAEET